jgi:hypothetical protein
MAIISPITGIMSLNIYFIAFSSVLWSLKKKPKRSPPFYPWRKALE